MHRRTRGVDGWVSLEVSPLLAYDTQSTLAAARELSEETGLSAGRLQYLGANFTSPGYSEEVLHIYLARDLHRGAAHLDPGEFLNVERHPLEELV